MAKTSTNTTPSTADERRKAFYARLVAIQAALKAPKTKYNGIIKSAYRTAEDVLEAAKPLCAEHGLYLKLTDSVMSMPVMGNDTALIHYETESKYGKKETNYVPTRSRIYIVSRATITDGEFTEEASSAARDEEMKAGLDAPQITCCASSYARKTALCNLFAIDNSTEEPKQQDAPQAAAPADTIIREVMAAGSREAVVAIFNQHPELQADPRFIEACKQSTARFTRQ